MDDQILNKLLVSVVQNNEIVLPDNLPIPTIDILNSVGKFNNNGETPKIEKKKLVNLDSSRIRLKPVSQRNESPAFSMDQGEVYEHSDHDMDMLRYKVDNLNKDQRKIWDYIVNNRNEIVTIQAGPGCGKSYALKTIAYNLKDNKFDTIIYKHDLLSSFKYNSRRSTVAKFVMNTLGMNYYAYKAFDKLLSSKLTSYEFILVITSMIKRAKLPNLKGGIVFLDEYTIISKPILLVILMLLEYHKIGTIVCGDRNQLQNIFNSKHAQLSSYTLAASFAKREFELHINERCSNENYNEIIKYISQFSSDKKLDSYAFAIIAAIFLRQLIEPANYYHLHLAGTHQELSDLAHILVCRNKVQTDFYTIDQSRLRDKNYVVKSKPTLQPTKALIDYETRRRNNEPPTVDKFLPYIPLVIGARYYVHKHSEYSQGVLESINPDDTLTMKMDNGSTIVCNRNTNDEVVFDQHRDFLLNGELGKLYAYPVYPSNFMTIHKCQGCTITENLDLILNNTQYQGLYVALSRVTNPNQIARVTIPNQISFIISTIINFPQHVENKIISVQDLKSSMINYVFYDVNSDIEPFAPLIYDFINSTNVDIKRQIREKIIVLAKNYPQTIIVQDDVIKDQTSHLLTMSLIIKYRDIILAVSCLDIIDRNVWVHEFLLANSEMYNLLPADFIPNSVPFSDSMVNYTNELISLANLNDTYKMEMSTMDYIESKSTVVIRMDKSDRDAHKKFVVKANDEYMFYESTEFCAKVYNKLKQGDKITDYWLIDELNNMILSFKNDETLQPEKINYKDNDNIFKPSKRRRKL